MKNSMLLVAVALWGVVSLCSPLPAEEPAHIYFTYQNGGLVDDLNDYGIDSYFVLSDRAKTKQDIIYKMYATRTYDRVDGKPVYAELTFAPKPLSYKVNTTTLKHLGVFDSYRKKKGWRFSLENDFPALPADGDAFYFTPNATLTLNALNCTVKITPDQNVTPEQDNLKFDLDSLLRPDEPAYVVGKRWEVKVGEQLPKMQENQPYVLELVKLVRRHTDEGLIAVVLRVVKAK